LFTSQIQFISFIKISISFVFILHFLPKASHVGKNQSRLLNFGLPALAILAITTSSLVGARAVVSLLARYARFARLASVALATRLAFLARWSQRSRWSQFTLLTVFSVGTRGSWIVFVYFRFSVKYSRVIMNNI